MRAGWGMYCLARVYDTATAVGAKTFIADITTTVPACNVQVAAILDWYFSLTSRAIKQLLASQPTPTFSFVFSHFLTIQVSRQRNWTVLTEFQTYSAFAYYWLDDN